MENCEITRGRGKQCKDSVGGLFFVDFFNYGVAVTVDNELELVTAILDPDGSPAVCYRYRLQGEVSGLEQTESQAPAAGTTFWAQVLSMTLPKLSPTTRMEVKAMAFGTPQVVVSDNNGNALFVGRFNGLDTTGGTIVTGQALADLSGYTLQLTGNEKAPANHIDGAIMGDPYAGLTIKPIVITGDVGAYALGGAACANSSSSGVYTAGTPLDQTNYIDIDVTVSKIGSWSLSTDTVNDYKFEGKGNFSAVGTQTCRLYGKGTPLAAQSDSFTVVSDDLGGDGICTIDVTVA